jgi:quercetin dioxygenase-like cupin family protein
MLVTESEDRTIKTPVATMFGLAAPSQGSDDLSTWRVEMAADSPSPLHTIDHEQVWMPIDGTFSFTIDGETSEVTSGQALIVPADAERHFHAAGAPAQALVCMRSGGTFGVPGNGATRQPLPWAA